MVGSIWRDPEDKVLLAELGGCVCGFGAEREDGATLDVERDGVEAYVGEVDVLAVSLDALAGPVVVEDILGKVDGDGGRVFFEDGGDEDAVTVEELVLDAEGFGVGGVVEEEGVQAGQAGGGLAVEGSVEVVQEPVPDCDGVLGCGPGKRPAVVLLADGSVTGVVPHEWVEGTESGPAGAESLGRVSGETANIRTNHGNLEDGVEVQDASNREAVLSPLGDVVTKPLSEVGAEARELFKN